MGSGLWGQPISAEIMGTGGTPISVGIKGFGIQGDPNIGLEEGIWELGDPSISVDDGIWALWDPRIGSWVTEDPNIS